MTEGPELTALMRNVQQTFSRIIEEVPYLPEELQMAVANLEDPSALSFLIAGALRIKTEERQALLEERDVARRLRALSEILARELEVANIGSRIQSRVQSELDRSQREYVLRQQLKAIQEELGERDPGEAEVDELREQLVAVDLPERVRAQVDRELARLEKLPQAAAEHGVVRTYLEWIASLPWNKLTTDDLDLGNAREVLDADHYDIDRVKDRILEFLAVLRLKPDARGSILCFVGPPGVGKTSLGQSIARALGRNFERISAGGVRDEAEIRGHRRTYIGAMPGAIIRALRDAGPRNPLFMLDEIDKLGSDYRGDPASALLEVLDPEQNADFRDHYLDVPFDLSQVMFVTTANTLDTIPGRCATAWRSSSSRATRRRRSSRSRALPRPAPDRAQRAQALADRRSPTRALRAIIEQYTREAGVRNLEREIGSICRKVAPRRSPRATAERRLTRRPRRRVRELLGRPRFLPRPGGAPREPGVATGLAWTPVGGDVLFVEATAMPGSGQADAHRPARRRDARVGAGRAVLRPRARAALVPALPDDFFATHDIHLHVPAGAMPKDGPSAGHHDGDRAGVALHRAPRAQRRGDDRRDHAHRPGAADRRAEGEGPRRPSRRHHHDHRPAAQRAGPRRLPGEPARGHGLHLGGQVEEVFAAALEPARDGTGSRTRRCATLVPAPPSRSPRRSSVRARDHGRARASDTRSWASLLTTPRDGVGHPLRMVAPPFAQAPWSTRGCRAVRATCCSPSRSGSSTSRCCWAASSPPSTSAFFIGIPLAMGLLLLSRWMARLERGLHARLLDAPVEPPYRPLTEPKRLGRMRERAADPATWRDLAYLLLAFPLGIVSFTVVTVLAALVVAFATMPAWWYAVPDGVELGAFLIDSWPEAIAAVPLAVPAFFLFALAVRWLARCTSWPRGRCSPAATTSSCRRRSRSCQDSRARIIAAADAERRAARARPARRRPAASGGGLHEARHGQAAARQGRGRAASSWRARTPSSHAAIAELRDLARGIHPAVLTDRGLAAALRDLATRASVPVELAALPDERLPEPVEAAAYFTVSEALTNVAKYARAGQARVEVARRNGHLAIAVADDGMGGASPEAGSGLRGLADRLGALGGTLAVESPPRAPARRCGRASPCARRRPRRTVGDRRGGLRAPAPLAAADAGQPRRRLRHRHAAARTFIWLTTGAGYSWPQWAIVGWGSVLAIHAWFAEGRHAGMLAAETQPER